MPLETIRDLMLPLGDYAVVHEDATMIDALNALEKAQANLSDTQHRHRAVLVQDSMGQIVGKLGYHAFIEGLETQYQQAEDISALSRSCVSEDSIWSMMEELSFWQQDFDHYAIRAEQTKVKDVMQSIEEHVDLDAAIPEAIHKLVVYKTSSLVVTSGNTPVGILRLSDVFSVASKIIKRRRSSNGESARAAQGR